ncbi:PIN domain-containing protein [Patescibacteria group bacterium]|nr:PIN domain-containing protein [Patescibacteria group bacterium]
MKFSSFKQIITKSELVALDSNIFIYQFSQHPDFFIFSNYIFVALEKNKLQAVTSIISYIEIISQSTIEGNQYSINLYKRIFQQYPNLKVHTADFQIADKTAELRRKYSIKTPDAIQLATAIISNVDLFISNDKNLKKVEEIKTINFD